MVNDRFIQLITKKLSDEIDESELAELNYMLLNDEECLQQYNFFKTYWAQDEEKYSNEELLFQRIRNRLTVPEDFDDTDSKKGWIRRFPFFWRSLAAVLVLGICVFAYYGYAHHPSTINSEGNIAITKTPSRTKSKIYLSDGSVVTLNSETVLRYPSSFSGPTREVYLNGEAFFNVTKDHTHPFIVHAGKMNIKVLGTSFNVKSYANDKNIETTLIKGAIEVTLSDRPSDRIILKPNEKLVLNNKTFNKPRANNLPAAEESNTNYALTNLTHLRSNDTTIVETSWVNNELVFKDEAFSDLANQMERWYGIKIKFKNSSTKDYHFTGVFMKENIVQALNALKMIEPFNYKYNNETVSIY
ncbi:MAG: FecR family protein [Bacteroidetes bacterium]|jgi:ferric-dicitrate binding protein FerR (iron transport regulator)|nr:FecR family protein [Bacteroidota bacterium]